MIEREKMTRQDILKEFPTASESQIDAILAMHHTELQKEKEKGKELKDASKELEEAKQQIEDLKAKAESGAPEDWESQISKLTEANDKAQKTIRDMQLKNSLLGKGFSADDADAYIKAINDGGDIADVLGKIKDNVISAYDKERMDKTPDPIGSSKDPDKSQKEAELAKEIAGSIGNNTIAANDIVKAYT